MSSRENFSKPKNMTDISRFTSVFEKIVYGKSEAQVFDDFLDISICCLSAQRYEEEYLTIIKKYERKEVDLFCELFAEMTMVMDNGGTGLTDCLGEFFTKHITRGRNGQFFTPEHVCDFMGSITIDQNSNGQKIFDPACGSGRMLLSAAKISRSNYFFGADIDNRCSKMTAINLCLNGLFGEVAWMNSLSMEHWGGYTITPHEKHPFIPTIKKLSAMEGYIYGYAVEELKERSRTKINDKTIIATQTKLEL